jgi:hypothetical protein
MSDITGQFEEASGFVRYLASDAAAFMTVTVRGGRSGAVQRMPVTLRFERNARG